jgi:hypothetical protein
MDKITLMTPGVKYTYKVKAATGAEWSGFSNEDTGYARQMPLPEQGIMPQNPQAGMQTSINTIDGIVDSIKTQTDKIAGKMIFRQTFRSATPSAIIAIPATAADLTFPSVVVVGIPAGATLLRVEAILVIGALLDTSTAENQVNASSKTLRVKKAAGSWGTDDVVALTFTHDGLQCKASEYGGGRVLFGGTDVKSEVDGNATYNFASEQTNRTDAVSATGNNLELLDVSVLLDVEYTL